MCSIMVGNQKSYWETIAKKTIDMFKNSQFSRRIVKLDLYDNSSDESYCDWFDVTLTVSNFADDVDEYYFKLNREDLSIYDLESPEVLDFTSKDEIQTVFNFLFDYIEKENKKLGTFIILRGSSESSISEDSPGEFKYEIIIN